MIKNDINLNQLFSQKEGSVASNMDGETVMLNIRNGNYYNLGEIGGEIWQLLKDPVSIENIMVHLIGEYEIEFDTCKVQVVTFIDKLKKEGLIEPIN